MKRKILSIILITILLSVSAIFSGCDKETTFIEQPKTWDWQNFTDVEEYSGFFDSKITKIWLMDTVDSARWVIFEDEDLIEKWNEFLSDLEIKAIEPHDRSEFEGGYPTATVTTEAATYYITFQSFINKTIVIGDYLYEFRSSVELPFDETYDEGEKRHGIVTPWD